MKIRSEEQNFSTSRSFLFEGKEGEEGGGKVKIYIEVSGITTADITRKLDELATEAQNKAKKIVTGQEAPQQIF